MLIISITLLLVQFGFFPAPSMFVPSLHRLKACIFKLFKPLASFSHVIDLVKHLLRTTAIHELAKISVLSITLQPVRFGFFTNPSTIVPSLHRLNVFLHSSNLKLHSYMLLDLVQPFLRAAVSLDLTEISIP